MKGMPNLSLLPNNRGNEVERSHTHIYTNRWFDLKWLFFNQRKLKVQYNHILIDQLYLSIYLFKFLMILFDAKEEKDSWTEL